MAERKFLLKFKMAPGDVSILTAFVRDFKLTHGDRYAVDIRSDFPAIWRHNPHLTKLEDSDKKVEVVKMRYDAYMKKANKGEIMHFVGSFHKYFQDKTRIHTPLLYPYPDLHISKEEKDNPPISGRYWVMVAGGKTDMVTKIASMVRLQEVIDRLRKYGLHFVQEGAVKKLCVHPALDNVLQVVGMTSIRDLIVNIYHAEGVICPITFPMHIAGALQRPCVVIAGGREDPHWEEYSNDWNAFGDKCAPVKVPHKFLHTMGQLDCCSPYGCWKQRTVRLNDNTKHDQSLCKYPVAAPDGQMVPKCLDMISTDHITEAVMEYYEDGYLPPINWSVDERNRWRSKGVPYVITNTEAEGDLQPSA